MATVRRKLFILQMNSLLRTTLKEWQRVYKAKSWVRSVPSQNPSYALPKPFENWLRVFQANSWVRSVSSRKPCRKARVRVSSVKSPPLINTR